MGYIQWVSTDFAWRRRGLARAITIALLDWITKRQVHPVELHATPEAEPVGLGYAMQCPDLRSSCSAWA